jgi:hypothetical protein
MENADLQYSFSHYHPDLLALQSFIAFPAHPSSSRGSSPPVHAPPPPPFKKTLDFINFLASQFYIIARSSFLYSFVERCSYLSKRLQHILLDTVS